MYLDGIFDMFDWFKKSQKKPPPAVEKVTKPKVAEPLAKTEKPKVILNIQEKNPKFA